MSEVLNLFVLRNHKARFNEIVNPKGQSNQGVDLKTQTA